MHCISNIGIIKTSSENFENLKNKLWITKSKTNDFYIIDLKRAVNKKILANNGIDFVLSVWTDYFGGCGEQGATLHHLTKDYKLRLKNKKFKTINKGIVELGFENDKHLIEDFDEFDSVGLGNYREYEDFVNMLNN